MIRALAFVAAIMGLGIALVSWAIRMGDASEAAHERRTEMWLAYTVAHHCQLVTPPSFFTGDSIWSCSDENGSYTVVRHPND